MKDASSNKKPSKIQELRELLPWLVNGTLDDKERVRVMNHLNESSEAQEQRDQLQNLAAMVSSEAEDSVDYKPSFNKLMAQIDQFEQERQQFSASANKETAPTGGSMRVVLGIAASALLVVAGFVMMQYSEPNVETLSIPPVEVGQLGRDQVNGQPATTPVTQRLAITFAENISSATLRSAFVETGAYIVSGPDDQGRYVVEIVQASGQSQAELLESMSAVTGVEYVALLD